MKLDWGKEKKSNLAISKGSYDNKNMPDDSDITNVSFGAPRELLSTKSYIIGAISLQKKEKLLLPFITVRSEMLVF